MAIDPISQVEKFLQEYCRAFEPVFAWADRNPPHSLCFGLVRALFEAGLAIEDLERIFQELFAEKLRPKSYVWICVVVKARIGDLAHERRS